MHNYNLFISEKLFQFILDSAIRHVHDPNYKKPPKKHESMLKLLFERGEQGATAEEIYQNFQDSNILETKKKSNTESQKPWIKSKEIEDISKKINCKLGSYFLNSSHDVIQKNMFMILKPTEYIEGKYYLKSVVDTRLEHEIGNYWPQHDKKSAFSSELSAIIRANPTEIDFFSASFMEALSLPEFRDLLYEQCNSGIEKVMYRFLFMKPFDFIDGKKHENENVVNLEKIYRKSNGLRRYRGLRGRIIDSIKNLSYIRSDLENDKKERIQLKLYEHIHFWRIRYLRASGKGKECTYLRLTADNNVETLFRLEKNGSMFKTFNNIFEEQWEKATEIQYEDWIRKGSSASIYS